MGLCAQRLGCCCGSGKDASEPLAHIETKRACTDIPMFFIFLGLLGYLSVFVWLPAYEEGDPNRLIRGVDWRGRICGIDADVIDKPYAYWPDPLNSMRFKVCTSDCNITQELWTSLTNITAVPPHESEIYLNKYCLPTQASSIAVSGFDSGSYDMQSYMGDLDNTLDIIGYSVGIAIFVSFFYIFLMKCCVGVLVWSTILAIIVGGAGVGYIFYEKSLDITLTANEVKTREYISYAAWGITGIFTLVVLTMRDKIKISIEVIKSAGRSIGDMPLIVFYPLFPLIIVLGFVVSWLVGSIYIFSAGTTATNETPTNLQGVTFIEEGDSIYTSNLPYNNTFDVIDYNTTIQQSFAPHFFMLLWFVQIGVYFTFTSIAGAVSDWYFTERDENGKKRRGSGDNELRKNPICASVCRTLRYHMGTIIFAALLIAIVQFVRWCIRYMERVMNGGKKPNKIQQMIMRMVDCLLWCLECCLDKISRNALIWTSIYGNAFCPSVCGSFALIWSNIARVAIITFFSGIVTTLGKIMIPIITTALCGLIILNLDPWASTVNSPVLPCVIIFIISFAVGTLFITVFDTAIDTVFLCFLIDEKQNINGTMMADDNLRKVVQKYEKESQAVASSLQRKNNNSIATDNKSNANASNEIVDI